MKSIESQPIRFEQDKKEYGLFEKIDSLLRDKKTAFAKLLGTLSPEKGDAYLNSDLKRFLDLSVAIPAAIVATPAILVLGLAKKLEDGGSAFFIQKRLRSLPEPGEQADDFTFVKIRSMREGADKAVKEKVLREDTKDEHDDRITKLGKVMRKYKLDELPQLFQVVTGEISAIGLRPGNMAEQDRLEERKLFKHSTSDDLYNEWKEAYNKGPLGLTGIMQVRGSGKIVDEERFHYDIFYTKNASLGLDLYLLWATLGRIAGFYPRRKSHIVDSKPKT